MTGAFNNMNKDNVLIYFFYIHLIFYKKYMIESLESRLPFYKKLSEKSHELLRQFVSGCLY